eukprot:9487284-Pyramimonas_sp.AAC.2
MGGLISRQLRADENGDLTGERADEVVETICELITVFGLFQRCPALSTFVCKATLALNACIYCISYVLQSRAFRTCKITRLSARLAVQTIGHMCSTNRDLVIEPFLGKPFPTRSICAHVRDSHVRDSPSCVFILLPVEVELSANVHCDISSNVVRRGAGIRNKRECRSVRRGIGGGQFSAQRISRQRLWGRGLLDLAGCRWQRHAVAHHAGGHAVSLCALAADAAHAPAIERSGRH